MTTTLPGTMPPTAGEPLLRVEGLSVDYRSGRSTLNAVRDISFQVAPAETVALVGGSGSGKSSTAHSIVRILPRTGSISAGRVFLGDDQITALGPRALRSIRGRRIGFIPQDPAVSLNPVLRVGHQVAEVLRLHGLADRRSAPRKALEALETAGLDRPAVRARQYPHELSGGMRQRVLIAIALAANPSLVIADEATSALDVTVQQHILDHLGRLTAERGTGVLMITHDLGVAADRADRIIVMHEGRIVEEGTPQQVIGAPGHPYTGSLVQAAPSLSASARPALRIATPGSSGSATPAPDLLLSAERLVKEFPLRGLSGGGTVRAVDDVSFSVVRGRTLGIVGESGSGKTTVARLLLRLTEPSSGTVTFDGQDITAVRGERLRALRQRLQVVFQNPYTSLNPKLSVADIVAEPLRSFGIGTRAEQRKRAVTWLERMDLPRSTHARKPADLSGGQRQRVAIARALVLDPALVVLDEPVSALDVLVQAQILNQLAELQDSIGVSYIFISHDLAVVRQVAHQVCVLRHGQVVEEGDVEQVLNYPRDAYTQQLVAAIPGASISQLRGPLS